MTCQHYQHASWCSSQCARRMVETFLWAGVTEGRIQTFCPVVGDLLDVRSVTAMELPNGAQVR